MHLVLISGLSGSGKSIALNVLEDGGYYCVDNLPSELLPQLIDSLSAQGYSKVGVAMDVRGGAGIRELPRLLDSLQAKVELRFLFLDAKDETLLKRFSETRRRHPLATESRTLVEAIRGGAGAAGRDSPCSATTSTPATSRPPPCATGCASSSPPTPATA